MPYKETGEPIDWKNECRQRKYKKTIKRKRVYSKSNRAKEQNAKRRIHYKMKKLQEKEKDEQQGEVSG